MANRVRLFHVLGHEVRLPGSAFAAAREIYGRQVYFAIPQASLEPGEIVVDLGANAGVFSVLAAKMADRVVAVEAQGGFAREIRDNARLNGVSDRVQVVTALVGAHTGVLADEGNLRSASHYDGVPRSLSMPELMSLAGLDRIDFLKIDIEGSEFDLLQNRTDWLQRVHKIAMEVHCQFGDVEPIAEVLRAAGFKVRLTDNDLVLTEHFSAPTGYLFAFR